MTYFFTSRILVKPPAIFWIFTGLTLRGFTKRASQSWLSTIPQGLVRSDAFLVRKCSSWILHELELQDIHTHKNMEDRHPFLKGQIVFVLFEIFESDVSILILNTAKFFVFIFIQFLVIFDKQCRQINIIASPNLLPYFSWYGQMQVINKVTLH